MGALRTGIVKSIRNKNCWEKSVVKNSKPIGSLKENNSIQINVLQTWCSNRVWLCWHSSPCPLGLRLVTMGQEELHPPREGQEGTIFSAPLDILFRSPKP